MFELMDLGRPFATIDEFDRAAFIGQGNLPRFHNPDFVEKRYSALLPIWKSCGALMPEHRPALSVIKGIAGAWRSLGTRAHSRSRSRALAGRVVARTL